MFFTNSESVRTITVDWDAESPAGSRFAEDGVDYATSSGSLSFAAGQDSTSFTVASLSDTFCESDERFRVRLSNPGHADLAADAVAWATITDVDCTPQDASIGDSTFAESAGTVTFTVSLTEPWPADDVTLRWATEECVLDVVLCPHPATEGEDYVGASGPVTIPAGAVSAPISVELLDDGVDEFAEYFWVRLSDPPDGFTVLPGETHPGPVGIGQISEDDADLPVLEFETDSPELVEGATFAFEVAVIGESARTIAVDWDTVTSSGSAYATGDVDYRGDSGRLSIRAGRRSARFTVASIADTQCEPDGAVRRASEQSQPCRSPRRRRGVGHHHRRRLRSSRSATVLRFPAGDQCRWNLRGQSGLHAPGDRLHQRRHRHCQRRARQSLRFEFDVHGNCATLGAGHSGRAGTPRRGPRLVRLRQRAVVAADENGMDRESRVTAGDRHLGPRCCARGLQDRVPSHRTRLRLHRRYRSMRHRHNEPNVS